MPAPFPPTPPLSTSALERIRDATARELQRPPPRSRRFDALLWLGGTLSLSLLAALVLRMTGGWIDRWMQRLPTLALLAALQVLGAHAAVAPRARPWQRLTLVLGGGVACALVLLRGTGAASLLPPWVCTLSHVGLDVLPLSMAVVLLRRVAFSWPRALAAGVSVGTVGAVLGEVGCGQGWAHVLLFHLPAWMVAVLVTVIISHRLRPHSFAP